MGVALRFYVHHGGPKATTTAPAVIKEVKDGGGILVPSVEDAQCVIMIDPNDENAIQLQKALAVSEREIPVLKSDWISTCLGRGAMLGPKANPPWGGLRLKYYPSAQEFFDDEPEEITKEAMLSFPVTSSECKDERIDVTEASENEGNEENPSHRLNLKLDRPKNNYLDKSQVPGRTAAEILYALSKRHTKYGFEDLVLMAQELAKTTSNELSVVFRELAASFCKAGKDYGVTAACWQSVWYRDQASWGECIRKLQQGDRSLDCILQKWGGCNNVDSPLRSAASATESKTRPESPKPGGNMYGAHTASIPHRPPISYGFTYRGFTGVGGPSRPAK